MNDSYILIVKDIIDSEFAVSADRAEKVYKLICKAIDEEHQINVSFEGIDVLITAFLNIIYGDLFKCYPEDTIDKYVKFINLKSECEDLIPAIKKRAIEFYKKA